MTFLTILILIPLSRGMVLHSHGHVFTCPGSCHSFRKNNIRFCETLYLVKLAMGMIKKKQSSYNFFSVLKFCELWPRNYHKPKHRDKSYLSLALKMVGSTRMFIRYLYRTSLFAVLWWTKTLWKFSGLTDLIRIENVNRRKLIQIIGAKLFRCVATVSYWTHYVP